MRMASAVYNTLGLFLFFLTSFAGADTPANCTYEEVTGDWVFSIGEEGFDNTIDCSGSFKVASNLKVNLLFPDVAVDADGNVGFWTMIYNQGFEVQISGRKYFAFSAFDKTADGKVISYCDKTLNGWSHDDEIYKPADWACYYGKKDTKYLTPPKLDHGKTLTELENRKYIPNQQFVDQINSVQKAWKAQLYGDYNGMSLAQLRNRAGGVKRLQSLKPRPVTKEDFLAAKSLPEEFDWRNVGGKNYVSPIRNQESCGSCYAFGTLAMFEARVRILTNDTKQPVFSTQDIVSCSKYSQGCEGGFPYLISKYAEDFGLVDEECFPYQGRDMPCKEGKCTRQYGTGYHYVGGFYGGCNEVLMRLELVKNGPISVSFEVYNDFLFYKGGIYHHTGLKDGFNPFEITNHAVLAIGYGADKNTGEKFWIVKNSWGKNWGENGYFRIRRGTDECAIESIAVAAEPVLK